MTGRRGRNRSGLQQPGPSRPPNRCSTSSQAPALIRHDTEAPGRPADANDMFETDCLEEIADELRRGVLDCYEELLEFRTPTAEELETIRSATGWTQ
ncbi:hypothetical protein [Streptomyces sp. NPDC088762]|uniref:hypothetical protein n=1 Tax=Streptomyces sp. NPDC088762 TaxID=3365891 RepID=UPI0038052B33